MKTKHGISLALAFALALLLTPGARAASVTATLDGDQASVGQPAQLTVTVTGSQDQPAVPSVDGLDISLREQSTQIQVINGSMTASICDTYQVTPQREGTFVIPPIRAGGAASQPITLRVDGGSGAMNSPATTASPGGNPSLPAPAVRPAANGSAPAAGRFGTVQVTLPQHDVYVGQLIPVEIRAYIPEDIQAQITDLPQMTSDSFAMNPLTTKPDQNEQIINGQAYLVMTWHSALTPVKAGDFPFSLRMPLSVVVQDQVPQPNDNDDPFNNFFRNAFASMGGGTKKDVTIESKMEVLKVQALPQAGRPANFGGAVGEFQVEATASPTNVNVGDPITLRLSISGTGNFDRVSSDMLAGSSQWKTYSTKTHFEAADSVGYQGVKTIEQPVIPNESNISSVPSLSFSYFDPELRHYVTRTTAPLSVSVSGSPASQAAGVASTTAPAAPAPPAPPAPASDLQPNAVEPGSFVSTLEPIFLSPWFVAGQSLPLLALLGGLGLVRRGKTVSRPEHLRAAATQRAMRQQLQAMDEAMRNRQTDAFFVHARSALQQRLGQEWNMNPDTITLAEVDARLGEQGGAIRPIFEMADQASYSDLHFADADLSQWRQVVVNEIQSVEKN